MNHSGCLFCEETKVPHYFNCPKLTEKRINLILDSDDSTKKEFLARQISLTVEHFQKLINEKNPDINLQLIANSNLPAEYLNNLYFEANDREKLDMAFSLQSNANCPLNILEDYIELNLKRDYMVSVSSYLIQHPNLSEALHTVLLKNANLITLRRKALRPDTTSKNLKLLEEIVDNNEYMKTETNMKEKILSHPNYKKTT